MSDQNILVLGPSVLVKQATVHLQYYSLELAWREWRWSRRRSRLRGGRTAWCDIIVCSSSFAPCRGAARSPASSLRLRACHTSYMHWHELSEIRRIRLGFVGSDNSCMHAHVTHATDWHLSCRQGCEAQVAAVLCSDETQDSALARLASRKGRGTSLTQGPRFVSGREQIRSENDSLL